MVKIGPKDYINSDSASKPEGPARKEKKPSLFLEVNPTKAPKEASATSETATTAATAAPAKPAAPARPSIPANVLMNQVPI